jgi:hypothetical protein
MHSRKHKMHLNYLQERLNTAMTAGLASDFSKQVTRRLQDTAQDVRTYAVQASGEWYNLSKGWMDPQQ